MEIPVPLSWGNSIIYPMNSCSLDIEHQLAVTWWLAAICIAGSNFHHHITLPFGSKVTYPSWNKSKKHKDWSERTQWLELEGTMHPLLAPHRHYLFSSSINGKPPHDTQFLMSIAFPKKHKMISFLGKKILPTWMLLAIMIMKNICQYSNQAKNWANNKIVVALHPVKFELVGAIKWEGY